MLFSYIGTVRPSGGWSWPGGCGTPKREIAKRDFYFISHRLSLIFLKFHIPLMKNVRFWTKIMRKLGNFVKFEIFDKFTHRN